MSSRKKIDPVTKVSKIFEKILNTYEREITKVDKKSRESDDPVMFEMNRIPEIMRGLVMYKKLLIEEEERDNDVNDIDQDDLYKRFTELMLKEKEQK